MFEDVCVCICPCARASVCRVYQSCVYTCRCVCVHVTDFCMFLASRLADIGLETFKLSELFTSILIPGFFLLACILQLHYFHKSFMKITDLEHITPLHRSDLYSSPLTANSALTNKLSLGNYKNKLYLYSTIPRTKAICGGRSMTA